MAKSKSIVTKWRSFRNNPFLMAEDSQLEAEAMMVNGSVVQMIFRMSFRGAPKSFSGDLRDPWTFQKFRGCRWPQHKKRVTPNSRGPPMTPHNWKGWDHLEGLQAWGVGPLGIDGAWLENPTYVTQERSGDHTQLVRRKPTTSDTKTTTPNATNVSLPNPKMIRRFQVRNLRGSQGV